MNGRLEGWRAVEEFSGLKEHRIRRFIGHYGFPKPVAEPCFQKNAVGVYRQSITNVWLEADVLSWLIQNNQVPTNHTIQTKGDGYGNEQDQCNGDRLEPCRSGEQPPGVRG